MKSHELIKISSKPVSMLISWFYFMIWVSIVCLSVFVKANEGYASQLKHESKAINQIESRHENRQSVLHPKLGDVWKEPVTSIDFVWIPRGCFEMGNTERRRSTYENEKPLHRVCLDGFWIGRFEVTNAQFRRYMPVHNSGDYEGLSLNEDNQPVVMISWNDAKNFASWLTERNEGKFTFRLPSEAEWEYACRAKTTTSRYWGNTVSDTCRRANVGDRLVENEPADIHLCRDNFFQASPVGSFSPNQFGLYDMLGNVWEWCEDVYGKDAYKRHRRFNPLYKRKEIGIDFRVIRGGSWQSGPNSVRCAKRSYNLPKNKFDVLGFRIVMKP